MSSLVVEVCRIDDLKPHPNADRLELAIVRGWQCCVGKGQHQAGDKIVFFPPDTILPDEWLEKMGVSQYVSKGRIRSSKLRGEPSFGLVAAIEDPSWEVGQDVAEYYGATKYTPPVKHHEGRTAPDAPKFPKYTDIENLRHYPDILIPGELVVITEKIHGTNSRVGLVEGEWMAGSRKLRRQPPEGWCAGGKFDYFDPEVVAGQDSLNRIDYHGETYWFPLTIPGVVKMLEALRIVFESDSVVLYGEIYGKGVQNLHYGESGLAYRAFDIGIGGRYLHYATFDYWTSCYGVPTVPVAMVGGYNLEDIRVLAGGPAFSGNHMREGVVVRPIEERMNPKTGRTIFKYCSDEYLLKQKEDFTDE